MIKKILCYLFILLFSVNVYAAKSGTGFFIDEQGTILTVAHLFTDESNKHQLQTVNFVYYDHKIYMARLLAINIVEDLAVLKIVPEHETKYFNFSDFTENQMIVVIGFPLDHFKVTIGSILGNESPKETALKLNICAGNSGSPVINKYGLVVGIANQALAEKGYIYNHNMCSKVGFMVPESEIVYFLHSNGFLAADLGVVEGIVQPIDSRLISRIVSDEKIIYIITMTKQELKHG